MLRCRLWRLGKTWSCLLVCQVIIVILYYMAVHGRRRGLRIGLFRHVPPVQPAPYGSSVCAFPKLDNKAAEVIADWKKYKRLRCEEGVDKDWVTIHKGRFIIQSEAEKAHGPIKCNVTALTFDTDRAVSHSDPEPILNNTAIKHDFYSVSCVGKEGAKYSNLHAGVPETVPKPASKKADIPLNVLVFGYDSMSHLAMMRHMPATRDTFVNKLGGIEMNSYNIMGDGTPAALMPMLLGQKEGETFEVRTGYPDAKNVDGLPWIWKQFKEAGYITSYNEDEPGGGVFQLRMRGFEKQPVDHYFRTFTLEPFKRRGLCRGSKSAQMILLDYVKEMFYSYPLETRKFIFTMQATPSHHDNSAMSQLDDEFAEYLQSLENEGFLNDTLVVLMADHGARFSRLRKSKQGTLEEKLPYFALRFPPWLKNKYKGAIANLKSNADVLTSPLDIHETFHELLKYTGSGPADLSNRGVSLFKNIPKSRDCEQADVGPHWCACLNWQEDDVGSENIAAAVAAAVARLNEFQSKYADLCHHLSVGAIHSAYTMSVWRRLEHEHITNRVVKQQETGLKNASMYIKSFHQLTFTTEPGGGMFQVTLSHDSTSNIYVLNRFDMSRINSYGSSSNCILAYDIPLREICYCKRK